MIVFVTGASSGFGRAIASRFAAGGDRVIVAGRRTGRLIKLQEESGGAEKIHACTLDVRDREAIQRAINELPAKFSEIDVLVNSAGLALGLEPANCADLDDWETMVDTNVKGLICLTRAVLPGMVSRNRGHIVNISSIAGTCPYPGGNVYGASKAFVQQFSRNLRADLLGTQVRVTDIAPGLAAGPEFFDVRFHGDMARAANHCEGADLLTSDDVADAVYWAATRPARVNINSVELMPVCEAWGPVAVHRSK